MEIKIEKSTEEMLKELRVREWLIWEKEVSRFDWHYDDTEVCYIIQGEVVVETEDGKKIELKQGDFVTFPKGLSCVWDIKKTIKKYFNFL
jgi:uncharacterized cupin superfamily protein